MQRYDLDRVFYFTGLMLFSERPGYRIDSRTIKRGSRPSIVIVSSQRTQTFASLQSSLLVLIWLLPWRGIGACRACHDKAKVTENGFHMRLLLRFWYWRFCRFIRAGDLSLQLLCKISTTCLPSSKVAFVVLFLTKLVLLNSDFNCKRSGIFGLRKRVSIFPHLVLLYYLGL